MDTAVPLTLRFRPTLRATIALPPSKSISARALIVQAFAGQSAMIDNLSHCDDTRAMRHALGEGRHGTTIDIGASGTAMRFLTAFFATCEGETHVLTGTPRMLQRPIGPLVDALRTLGAEIHYEGAEGFPPLRIVGHRLQGGRVSVPASISSQYISALMMAGAVMPQGLVIELLGKIASRPYIEMTLELMRQWGADATFCGNILTILPGNGYHRQQTYRIEPDWSAASYWYSLVALSPDAGATVKLTGLSAESIQGDRVCATLFRTLGVETLADDDGGLRIVKAASYRLPSDIQHFDMADCPDLAQGLVVAAALLGIPFACSGLESLKIKETDRMAALISEMEKLGLRLESPDDGHLNFSPSPASLSAPIAAFSGSNTHDDRQETAENAAANATMPCINTYDDHRMAMAFAPAAWIFPGLNIAHPEVVSKSYPEFWQHLSCLTRES